MSKKSKALEAERLAQQESTPDNMLSDENIEQLLDVLSGNNEEFDYSLEDEKEAVVQEKKKKSEMPAFGFGGAYAYDILLYIGRNLALLGKKVLVVDRTPNREVMRIIRVSDDIEEGETPLIDFCGVDVTCASVCSNDVRDEEQEVDFNNYDVLLFDFGANVGSDMNLLICDRMYYVFDMYRSTAEIIRRAEVLNSTEVLFVFRDELPVSSLKARRSLQAELSGKKAFRTYQIAVTKEDAISRYVMEEEQKIDYTLASEPIRELVDGVCLEVLGDMPVNKYKKMLASMKKQRK